MTKLTQLLRRLPLALIACSAIFIALSAGIASAHVHHGHAGHQQSSAGARAHHNGKPDGQAVKSQAVKSKLPLASTSESAAYKRPAANLSVFQAGNSTWAYAQPQSCGGNCLTLCGSSVCHCMQGAVVDLRVHEPRRSTERHALSRMRPLATFPSMGLDRPPKA